MIHALNGPIAEAYGRWLSRVKNIRRFAQRAGVGRSTVYDWLDEVAPVPLYAVEKTFQQIPDLDALGEVIGAGRQGIVLSRAAIAGVVGDVRDEMMQVGEALGVAMGRLSAALSDRVITAAERRDLRVRLDEVIRQVEEAKASLDVSPLVAKAGGSK